MGGQIFTHKCASFEIKTFYIYRILFSSMAKEVGNNNKRDWRDRKYRYLERDVIIEEKKNPNREIIIF